MSKQRKTVLAASAGIGALSAGVIGAAAGLGPSGAFLLGILAGLFAAAGLWCTTEITASMARRLAPNSEAIQGPAGGMIILGATILILEVPVIVFASKVAQHIGDPGLFYFSGGFFLVFSTLVWWAAL